MTTPTLLREAGEALYGDRWRVPLAGALDVNERTVRRWEVEQSPIPDGVWIELKSLLAAHGKRVRDLERRIPAAA